MKIKIPEKCPFCGGRVIITSNKNLYGKQYGNGMCLMCTSCKASVGVHDNGNALGILANREMKILKRTCHALFNEVWRTRTLDRDEAYGIFAEKLNIERRECHFGYFDTHMLLNAINILSKPGWYESYL